MLQPHSFPVRRVLPIAALVRGLSFRDPVKQRPLWLELVLMIFDKVFLAAALLGVAFFFNKLLEDYRSKKAWQSEIARQTLVAGRDLTEASYTLASRHGELAQAERASGDTLDPRRHAAFVAKQDAGNALLAKCEFARTFYPKSVVFKFREYHRHALAANPTVMSLSDGSDVSLLLLNALESLAEVTRPLNASLDSRRPVLPEVESTAASMEPQCIPPLAETGGVIKVTATTGAFEGRSAGKILMSWFDFDNQPDPKYSVQPLNGRGVAYGLKPGTTYYYRFVARNECGVSRGDIRSFTTPAQ